MVAHSGALAGLLPALLAPLMALLAALLALGARRLRRLCRRNARTLLRLPYLQLRSRLGLRASLPLRLHSRLSLYPGGGRHLHGCRRRLPFEAAFLLPMN